MQSNFLLLSLFMVMGVDNKDTKVGNIIKHKSLHARSWNLKYQISGLAEPLQNMLVLLCCNTTCIIKYVEYSCT